MPSRFPSSSPVALGLAFVAGSVVGCFFLSSKRVSKWRNVLFLCSNNDGLEEARAHLWKIVEHSFTGALIYSGDRLRLYNVLAECGPITAKMLAEQTGFSERWLLEWLAQMTAAGICKLNPSTNKFSLKHEYALLLQSPECSQESLAGMFQFLHALVNRSEVTTVAIQTGIGVDYDYIKHSNNEELQHDVIQGIERKNRNWFANKFVDDVIGQVRIPSSKEPLMKMLERGITVADIGCGCGGSTIALAKHFPKSIFYAYELSPESLRVMRERVKQLNLLNITVCNVAECGIDQGPNFDFVYSHDVLHDMTNPRALILQVRERLVKTGCWVIVDVECQEGLHENVTKPGAAVSLGFSCLLCLSSSTCKEGGQGLGTLGFHCDLAREWMSEAGFEYFERIKIKSLPMNSCFVVG